MRKYCLLSTLVLTLLMGTFSVAQDFSNKGKEFWVSYSYHVGMNGNGTPSMTLYISSDVTTTYKVEAFGAALIQTGTVFANQVAVVGIPNTYFINDDGLFNNRAILVTAEKPVVLYSFITRSQASAATLCLPTNVLGKEYYAASFTQISNEPNSNSYFTIIGVEDNTTVEITPTANTKGGWLANTTHTVTLNKGQIYQVLGTTSGTSGVDLTGSTIRSVAAAGGGCKRIAVFSGTGKIAIGCGGSSDNLYQQLYPVASWGKKYLTLPSYGKPNNYFRILRSDPTTNVYLNGVLIPPSSFTGNFYQFLNTTPNMIEADKPVSVIQYFTTQNCLGNGSPYDPDMIVLNPVEQNINKVTLVNAALTIFGTHQHNIHVIMRNGGTGISSFTLDGVPVPTTNWGTHPSDPNYSYLYLSNVAQGNHTLYSDSGFNAIAYGFGNAESYGYSAGTNVKDIYQYISLANQYATVNFPATCRNTPFYFSMTFPYQPTSIQWQFNGLFPDVTIPAPVYNSTTVVNGRTLYQYDLPTAYSIPTAGTYPIKVIAENPTPDGCGGVQEIDFDVVVYDPPVADFNFSTNGCLSSPVQFTDNSNGNGRTINNWHWNFGDGNLNNSVNNPSHNYAVAGTYTVKYAIRTDVGCISDTVAKVVVISDPPQAIFGFRAPQCAGKPITFSDTSTASGPGISIVKWHWNFGDGTPVVVASSGADQVHTYANPGVYTVSLMVETNTGCASTAFTRQLTINPNPVAAFNLPAICLPSGSAQFTDLSSITGGTISNWSWDFGDGNSSASQNPLHIYSSTGPFTVGLTVTSAAGCENTLIQTLNTVFAEPQAAFSVAGEVCLGTAVNFTDQSTVQGGAVTQWNWNFGDGNSSSSQHPSHTYAAAGTYTVTLGATSAQGCQTVNNIATQTIVVHPLPTVGFTPSAPACEGGSMLFTSTSVPNAGNFAQYNWTVNGNAAGNSSTLNYVPPTAGTYTVALSATTDNGCSGSATQALTVHPKPVAGFALPAICMPAGTATFSSSSTISSGTITGYNWNFGDGNTASTASATHTYASTGPFNVTLTVVSDNGCTDDSTSVLNTIYAEPQASFSAPAELCLGTAISFNDQSIAPGSSITGWSWNFGDGNTASVQHPSHTYLAPGTYVVTLSVISAEGCQSVTNIATRSIVVNDLPAADFNISLPGCAGRELTFTDASVANAGSIVKWTWNFGDGNTAVLNAANPFTHVYAGAGNYTATLEVETDKGCVSLIRSKPVEINVLPSASFIPPVACLNDTQAPFTDNSTVSPGTITGWQWNFGDPNANAGNPNTSGAQHPTHHYTVAGNYTATLVVTSDKGCTDTVSHAFEVNGSPVAGYSIENSGPVCSNRDVQIRDASTVSSGHIIKVDIYWDYANDPTLRTTVNNPTPGASYTHRYPEFGTPASRTVTIRYITYTGDNCLSTLDRTVTLLATPSLVFGNIPPLCEDAPGFLVTQAQVTNGLPGSGIYSGTGINAAGFFDPATAGAGQQTLTYSFTGTNGCVNTVSGVMEINPVPGINAGPDKVVLEGGSVTLTPALASGMSVTYAWSPIQGLNDPTLPNPSASPSEDITYTLTVTSDKGCQASDQVFVKVLKALIIPNIFSPNGDNVHDRWEIPYLESYPGCTIDIYNRYGQLVYHTVGYASPWDGKVNGKDVPVGTYYYVIDPKNGRARLSGYVDVIR